MADIKLFSTDKNVTELEATSVTLEKELQTLIEQNMPAFFGVTFLKSEHQITNGRIDSLGLDENNSPVIFEYKRSTNENVINQGLFYLDWLLDHKADFKLLVMDKLGAEASNNIDWSVPCVICIANDFTKYDEHAVNQMQRNIKLVRYKKFGDGLILFEHLNVPKVNPLTDTGDTGTATSKSAPSDKTFLMQYAAAPKAMQNTYDSIKNYILSLGDDIIENQLKLYIAFKKVKNFVCAEIYKDKILLNMKINPDTLTLEPNFTKDIRNIGHWGTGDLQVIVKNAADFEKAKVLINRAYNEN